MTLSSLVPASMSARPASNTLLGGTTPSYVSVDVRFLFVAGRSKVYCSNGSDVC